MLILTVIALLCHLAGVIAAMHALMHTRTAQGAMAWTLGLLLLPYLTLVLYLYLGRSSFRGYEQARRLRHAQVRDEAQGQQALPPECARLAALTAMLGRRFHPGQSLRLLIDGEATFAAILAAIAEARDYVLMQFFVIHDDRLGRRVRDALLERAAAGVSVCVLYDGVGSHALPRRYVDSLRAGGVAIHRFAAHKRPNRFQLNFRNHRKIVVVDGARAFVGGLNVGDEYLGLKPPLAPWRDTHLELIGPAVADVQRSFAHDWHWATGAWPPQKHAPAGNGAAWTLIADTGPADTQENCALIFVAAIHAARRRVWLSSPYFVPDAALAAALRLAVERGVDVRVLMPSRPDHRTVFLASSLHANAAARAGVGMYRYQPGFVHQKVLLVDDDVTMIGSMNLDSRSFRLNFEIGALNVDRRFAAEVETMLREDFARAERLTVREYDEAPYFRRLAMHVARLFDPIL